MVRESGYVSVCLTSHVMAFFFNKGKCVNLNSRFVNKKSQICQNNTVEKLIEKK